VLAVLVVDDEPAVAEELTDGLAALGFRVLQAHSATDAKRLFREDGNVGVVITDVRMPGDDGLHLARFLLHEGGEAGLRPEVVLITGHATLDDAESAIRVGVSAFIRKPFRLAQAAAAVRAAMAKAETRRTAANQEAQLRLPEAERAALIGIIQDLTLRLRQLPATTPARNAVEQELSAIAHALRAPQNASADHALPRSEGSGHDGKAWCAETVREGVAGAVHAVELLEELHRLERPGSVAQEPAVALPSLLPAVAAAIAAKAEARGIRIGHDEAVPATEVPGSVFRILLLAGTAALTRAQPGWTLDIAADPLATGPAFPLSLTLLARPPGSAIIAPPPASFDDEGGCCPRPQGTLALAVARRIARDIGARLAGWNAPDGAVVFRLVLAR
jgi:FixJ family two-component response regulator